MVMTESPAARRETEAAKEHCQCDDTNSGMGSTQVKRTTAAWEIAEVTTVRKGGGYGDGLDDFSLSDALDDHPTKRPTPKLPKKPVGGTGDFDLSDYFDTPPETTTKPGKATTKPYPKKPDDFSLWDVIHTTTTKKPKTTKAPPKKNPAKDPADFDLSDALDDQNDGKGGGKPNVKPGGGSKGKDNPSRGGKQAFSDDDLASVLDDGEYHPDKKKGGSDYDAGTTAETGTIAGIASALVVALVGAVSSYISYQQKKFCFSIQQGLNAEYVKGENTEAVVTEEPQVKYSVLETQSAEPPPPPDNAKV
ncbi:CD99 antigen-like protein 2 isoform X1 [Mauremys reevesii]|uniref:CD99 antigen-like protein 2 isoform X1 n=1 Tax=Mauremys reevesii TaxID=260615 RepID=UPI00193F9A0F|nr:CD99 antigen-like protein 2 isoform X1 [Mauremys reevesii]